MNILERAKATMEMLQRAPKPSESERSPCILGDQRFLQEDAVLLFEKALNALNFFEPHFQTYDDVITEARKSWWFRLLNAGIRVDGMIKLRNLRRSFKHYRDVVRNMDTKFIVIDPKLCSAADSWITWHELEERRMMRGPYR